jgi:hypothetical protein
MLYATAGQSITIPFEFEIDGEDATLANISATLYRDDAVTGESVAVTFTNGIYWAAFTMPSWSAGEAAYVRFQGDSNGTTLDLLKLAAIYGDSSNVARYYTEGDTVKTPFEVEAGGIAMALGNPVGRVYLGSEPQSGIAITVTNPSTGLYWVSFDIPDSWNAGDEFSVGFRGDYQGSTLSERIKFAGVVSTVTGTAPPSMPEAVGWTGRYTDGGKIALRANGRVLIPGFELNSKYEFSGGLIDLSLLALVGDQAESRLEFELGLLGYEVPLSLGNEITKATLAEVVEKTILCNLLNAVPDFRREGLLSQDREEAEEDFLAECCTALEELLNRIKGDGKTSVLPGETLLVSSSQVAMAPQLATADIEDIF